MRRMGEVLSKWVVRAALLTWCQACASSAVGAGGGTGVQHTAAHEEQRSAEALELELERSADTAEQAYATHQLEAASELTRNSLVAWGKQGRPPSRGAARLFMLGARVATERGALADAAASYRSVLDLYARGLARDALKAEAEQKLEQVVTLAAQRKSCGLPSLNQPSLKALGAYLVSVHSRLHPIFSDGFLASLPARGASDPLNAANLSTSLEIALDTSTGGVNRIGILRSSGVPAFDVAALDAVARSAPFGPAPEQVQAKTKTLYLVWEFQRNPAIACSTYNARAHLLPCDG